MLRAPQSPVNDSNRPPALLNTSTDRQKQEENPHEHQLLGAAQGGQASFVFPFTRT